MRGEVSTVFHRYAEANNKYLDNYNPEEPSSYITYLDANNLYGWAMSKPLPRGSFRFIEVEEKEEIFKQPSEGTYVSSKITGRVLEVDLEYPPELHESHNDYPFLPERLNDKSIPNLMDKKYYILNEHNLLQALKRGLRLVRIHRVLQFDQTPWLKAYIDFNTNLRAQSKNAFEKDFFKLMNNAVFGKTMENIRKRCNIQILNDDDIPTCKKLNDFISKPNYKEPIMITQSDINIFQLTKTTLKYDKPIYVGTQILDLSKTLMHQFHYDYMKPKFGMGLKTLCTDTDSIMYKINSEDFYHDISGDVNEWFDTSGYRESKGGIEIGINKKAIGKFKDESGDEFISHFCANKSKSYSYKLNGKEGHNVLKGFVRAVKNKMIDFEGYKKMCI